MNSVLETIALIAATIIVGLTLLFVPTPKQKPPEIDEPPPAAVEPPTPQEVVSPTLNITAPFVRPDVPEKDRLADIEVKLLHIQQQVQRMEKKVE